MRIEQLIEHTETCLWAATTMLSKEREKPNPRASFVSKWADEVVKQEQELSELKKKQAAGIRFVCEKCWNGWSAPSKKCPKCGYENKGLIGNLMAKFGF